MKSLRISNFLKHSIIFILPLILISVFMSYTIYKQDIRSFHAVMENNERQILDFQEELIAEHLKTLEEDINYLANMRLSNKYVESGFNPEINLSVVYTSFIKRRKIYSVTRSIIP